MELQDQVGIKPFHCYPRTIGERGNHHRRAAAIQFYDVTLLEFFANFVALDLLSFNRDSGVDIMLFRDRWQLFPITWAKSMNMSGLEQESEQQQRNTA